MQGIENIKYYLYGYLNNRVSRLQKDIKSLRAQRVEDFKIYLNFSRGPKWVIDFVIKCVIKFEVLLSIAIELYYYLVFTVRHIGSKRQVIRNKILYYGIREQRLMTIINNAHIDYREITIISSPCVNIKFEGFEIIPLLSVVSSLEILKAFIYSVKTTFLMNKKYGKTDFLFRSYSSLEFYLACFCFQSLDKSNKVLYSSTYSRWGYLFGNLKNKTIFLQHGMLGNNLPFLITTGGPDVGYFLNEEEKDNCCRLLFNKKPEIHYLDGLKFTANEVLLDNGKINVLVVCNLIYFNKEVSLATILHKKKMFNIYLKPHPLDSYDKYINLSKSIPIIILNKEEYPRVDLVISYSSTLAIEYQAVGVKVIWHDKRPVNDIIEEIERDCVRP